MERVSQKAKAVVSFFMCIMDTTCEKLAASICLFRVDARLVLYRHFKDISKLYWNKVLIFCTRDSIINHRKCISPYTAMPNRFLDNPFRFNRCHGSYCSVVVGVTSTSSSELSSKSHAARIV
ncbi:hypothetical protein OIU79_017238 [Salix purpurea]|uniref:Uncharacterized protein n=1 Tax=Salix purpurea TaxID=77065 RepID=A0A9Q1AJK1_SALPP|nr:hypothetical protein OIU79_017238 [Salix purpurea]